MADTKVTGLDENSSPATSDMLYIIDDPGGTPASQKVTIANVKTAMGVPDFTNLTDWTPSLTQSGAVSNTVTYAKYALLGNLCYVCANLAVTGAGTGNNDVIVGNLPKTPEANGAYGIMWFNDNGTAWYVGAAMWLNAGGFSCRVHAGIDDVGKSPNFALANGDAIFLQALFPWADA